MYFLLGKSTLTIQHQMSSLTFMSRLWLGEALCEAWAWSRCRMPYRKVPDVPERLKVSEVKPRAIVLWTLAHSYWFSAVLLLLALPLRFSKDCAILKKVTRRQVDSPFMSQILFIFRIFFLEAYNSWDIFATDVLSSYKNGDRWKTLIFFNAVWTSWLDNIRSSAMSRRCKNVWNKLKKGHW